MKYFQHKPLLHKFSHVDEFLKEFSLTKEDFILASRSTWKRWFAPFEVSAVVHFKDEYGRGEPTDSMIDGLRADFLASGCTRIFAIGGGAVIDMAKILVLDGTASASDYYQRKVPLSKAHTLVAVPTTCGSGSEASNVSIAEIASLGTKLGLADDTIYADDAVLIPELLSDLPYEFFASSAIDALIHAMESFVSPRANLYTRMFSTQAIRMIISGFLQMEAEGPEVRLQLLDEFLTASNMAGIAFGNAGTGAVHAMSYPLSGVYHVTHGEANYQFLVAVFRAYSEAAPGGVLTELEQITADALGCAKENLYPRLEELLSRMIPRKALHEYGMKGEEIRTFAESVQATQGRLLGQSYVRFDTEKMMKIYQDLY